MPYHHALVMLNGERLRLKDILNAGRTESKVALDPHMVAKCERTHKAFMRELAQGRKVYGVNVGVGALKHKSFDGVDQATLNRDLLMAHSAGIGDRLPLSVVRMAMLLRVNTLMMGLSGSSPELMQMLVRLLNAGITPIIQGFGSIGCGDINQNGQLGYALIGGGLGQQGDTIAPMHELIAQAGIEPYTLHPKDGITIISNNAFALAEAASLAYHVVRSIDLLLTSALAATVAMKASPAPWQAAARLGIGKSQHIGTWLSQWYDMTPWEQECTVHDPLSIRFLPEIYGAIYDELGQWIEAIERHTHFQDENPLMLDGKVHPSGGSYLLHLTLRTESLRIALSHALRNTYNLCAHLIAGRRSGLNVNLVANGSVMTGFGPFLKVAGALSTQGIADAAPVSSLSLILADSLEDECNHLPLSLSRLRSQVRSLEDMSAVVAIMAAQALDLSQPARPQPVEALYQLVRKIVPFAETDKPLSGTVEAVRQAFVEDHLTVTESAVGKELPLRAVF